MELKIFLTADVHLGMKFARYPEVQENLSEARFETFRSLVERANGEGCNLFVIAGDLFDRVSLPKEAVVRAASILGEFQGELSAVLPGNHDFHATGSDRLWSEFRSRSGDRTLVLTEKRVYPLDHYNLSASLYPAPCEGKHSDQNAVGWVRAQGARASGMQASPGPAAGGQVPPRRATQDPAAGDAAFHIGIAHGSLMGVSPDFDQRYYPMTREELEDARLDLWLLGHTHAQFPARPDPRDRIFYPGTPEPDGFDCAHEGSAWIITLKKDPPVAYLEAGNREPGGDAVKNPSDAPAALSARSVSTGRFRFLHRSAEIAGAADLETLRRTFTSGEYAKTLVKLSLRGRLPRELAGSIASLEEEIAKAVLHLHRPLDVSELREEITGEDIAREFTAHSFPHRLLSALSAAGDHEALQIAYEMIREARR